MSFFSRTIILILIICFIVFLAEAKLTIVPPVPVSRMSSVTAIDPVVKNNGKAAYKWFGVLSPVRVYMQSRFGDDVKNPCPSAQQLYPDLFFTFVDFTHALPDGYVPADLVPLPGQYVKKTSGTVCMRVAAADALSAMLADAATQGHFVVASSAFRSSETQETILNGRLQSIGEVAYTHVALPGHSEHQLGLAVDLTAASVSYSSAAGAFGDSVEGVWIARHAADYGFVQSYPYGKEPITGYIYEPWHYRYVGVATAQAVVDAKLTLTEYLQATI